MAAGAHFVKNAIESVAICQGCLLELTALLNVYLQCLGSIRYPLYGQPVNPSGIYPVFALKYTNSSFDKCLN